MSGETQAHLNLKRLAREWAANTGLRLAACEVRIPKSPYRADVPAMSRRIADPGARVALFECKQCRADFLKDCADEPGLRVEAAQLATRLRSLTEMIAYHRPDLRRGESLFPEYDCYDLCGLKHETLRTLETALAAAQQKLVNGVKFSRLHKYHAAEFLYLVTGKDIARLCKIPVGWGLPIRAGETNAVTIASRKKRIQASHREYQSPFCFEQRCASSSRTIPMRALSNMAWIFYSLLRSMGLRQGIFSGSSFPSDCSGWDVMGVESDNGGDFQLRCPDPTA